MAEVVANILTSNDGTITTLAAPIASTGATTITTNAVAPTALQTGEFRIRVDNELMLVTAGQATTTWTVTRAVEDSVAATHTSGKKVRHVLTAGAIAALISGGGGLDPGSGDGIMAFGHNLAELGEATSGSSGLLILGDEDAGIDFDTHELVGISGRWVGTNKFTIMSQLDTWALGLEDVSIAQLTSYTRPREAIMYGRPHTFLTGDVDVDDSTIQVNNASQFEVAPFRIRHYTVTPTGFDDPSESFTGCTWERTDGTSSGTETFPGAITPVKQGEVGGYGMVPRIIHHIGAIYAAGFKIEITVTAYMVGSADDKAMTVGTYLANWNESDDVPVRPVNPSGGLGMVGELTGPPNDNGAALRESERAMTMTSQAWSALSGIASPTKEFGDPDVYAKMASGAEDNGEFYAYTMYGRVVEA